MRIGITFDIKDHQFSGGLPEDWQEEFDSPQTIEAIAAVLRQLGHEVTLLGDGPMFVSRLLADPPDFVFNFAEGQGVSRCREARVPAILELLGVPYTGSDALSLAATLDKDVARRLVASHGVKVAPGFVVETNGQVSSVLGLAEDGQHRVREFGLAPLGLVEACQSLTFPLIVKPAWEGSSKGIRRTSLVYDFESLEQAVNAVHRSYNQPALVEEFIAGEEVTVGIIGNDPPRLLGMLHVLPRQKCEHFIYSLEVKRNYRRLVDYESPPRLPAEVLGRVEQAALRAFRALGCRDVCRLDFRIRNGEPYFLEANPLPGLHPEDSDLVILARLNGWSYTQLITSILEAALHRYRIPTACAALPC